MQEFYVNVTRKIPNPLSLEQARSIFSQYEVWQVETIDVPLVSFASKIQERNQLSFWDSLIIATAIQGDVKILYSEDLNAGQIIEGLEVVNPILQHWYILFIIFSQCWDKKSRGELHQVFSNK